MSKFCGIDLGTTNSTLSVIDIAKQTDFPMKKLASIPINQYNETLNNVDKNSLLLPSYFFFKIEEQEVYIGSYAKHIYASGDRPMQTLTAVKTMIGGESMVHIPDYADHKKSCQFDMTQCSSLLLRTIRESTVSRFGENISNVVITVPAAFNSDEREATINAALIAGFENPKILDEPTATLLYFVNGGEGPLEEVLSDVDFEKDKYILVYDLGGGTLDVSISKVRIDENDGNVTVDILARSPREDFGGNDFDQILGSYFLHSWEKVRTSIEDRDMAEQNTIISRIVSNAEKYKIEISNRILDKIDNEKALERLKINVSFQVIDGMNVDLILTKNDVDQIFLPFTEETGSLLAPINLCLHQAGLNAEDISVVLLTGGMTKFYSVKQTIRKFFSNKPLIEVDSETSVSKGAAIHAYNEFSSQGRPLVKLKLTDRMADDVFIKVKDKFELLIPRETIEESREFEYIVPEDKMFKIPIFLYHGLNLNNPCEFTPIAGKYIYLDENKTVNKGDLINLKWSVDKNKVIMLTFSELNESININQSKQLGIDEAARNYVNEFEINP